MIVSASYRTDIPAYFSKWFVEKLEAGFCEVPNPYSRKSYRVSLNSSDVDGYVFWTKNAAPFIEIAQTMAEQGAYSVFQYTITGSPNALEANTPSVNRSVDTFKELSRRFGSKSVVWRYDPILVTSLTDHAWHFANFAGIAKKLSGMTDEVVVSYAQPYRKSEKNIKIAAKIHDFDWRDPSIDEKQALIARLAEIAKAENIRLTTCAQPELSVPGVSAARCIDADRLSEIAGREIAARQKGNRSGCLCSESRDIGQYDTCPMGCVYCYAVSNNAKAAKNYKSFS